MDGSSTPHGFHHAAWLYRGDDEFVAGATSFLREGLEDGEPMLVAVPARKIGLLRAALGADAGAVAFADMDVLGANPARIIPAWRDFVAARRGGRPARGIGEPIGPARAGAELVECHRHESLLNLAFADTPAFRLLCPYDCDALDPAVVDDARRTHPFVTHGERTAVSPRYHDGGPDPHFGESLPDPPPGVRQAEIHLAALPALRAFVARQAARAGLAEERAADLVVAVNELATNTVRHGGGRGRLRVWHDAGALVWEVRDAGRIDDPLVDRRRPRRGQIGGYGLWLANQLCDLVQLRSSAAGTVVRVHMRLAPT